jgi:hypothetical protein
MDVALVMAMMAMMTVVIVMVTRKYGWWHVMGGCDSDGGHIVWICNMDGCNDDDDYGNYWCYAL